MAPLAVLSAKGVPFDIGKQAAYFSSVTSGQSPANITVAMYNEIEDMKD
jgi:hypothetical protein